MFQNLLTLGHLLLLLACGLPTAAGAQHLALSAPAAPTDRPDDPEQKESVALTVALDELEKEHDVRFNYASQLVANKRVSKDQLQPKQALEKTLVDMLPPLGLRFERMSSQIYGIYPVPPREKVKRQAPGGEQSSLRQTQLELVARLGLRPHTATVERDISGTVTDENDEGLPGVNVLAKNTTIGTVTDVEGNYRLTVPDDTETLVFSSVGFLSQEVPIGSQSSIDITMDPDVKSLEEVVVVGYGTQKKSDLTGSVASVAPEDINRVSERRLETALQGRAPGVQVARGEGSPGSGSKVTIRGAGSIGDTSPLWVVDGVPQNPGNYFNMNDVASIEILKDASAAAIYGARAAHGVILVTTKRGAEGKVNVNFNTSVGQRRAVNLPDMLDRNQFITASTIARENAGQAPEDAWANPEGLPDTDWVDEVFGGDGIEQTYNLSVSGGNENANFFISGAYDRENGIMIDNYFERFSVRANSDFKIGEKIKIGESLLVSRTQENPTAEDGRDLEGVFRAIPIMPIRDPDNPFGGWGTAPTYFQGANPVAVQRQNHIQDQYTRLNGNLYAEIEPLAGLTLRGSFGANISARVRNEFREAFSYGSNSNSINSLTYLSADDEEYNTNLVLTYTNTIGKHNFTVLGGFERFTEDAVLFEATANEFPLAFAESFQLANGEVDISNRATIDEQYRLQSLFGRINYVFADKYLLTANVRRDGSSRFGPANQYGVFPSVSVGWRIIEEGFLQNATFLSDLKLRASYGVLGSDRIDDYIFARNYSNERSTYIFDASRVDGGTKVRGYYLRRFPNTQVKWEEVEQINVGVDVGLLEGRFNLTADYYIKRTTDMLIGVALPSSFGVSRDRDNPDRPDFNLGELENRGFELGLNYRQNVSAWTFDISANAAWNQNEVTQLNEDDQIFSGNTGAAISGNAAITEVGRPLGTFYGLVADGIIQDEAELQRLNDGAPDGVYQANETAPGDLRYRDLDGDGEITPEDRDYIGNPWPKLNYGLNANINFRAFDLTLFFQGVQGVDIFNATKPYFRTTYNDYNTSERVFESWTAENPTDQPRLIIADPNGNFRQPSSYFVEDGSYLKLRNIQLGYSLPETLISRINLTSARVFVNAQNILTFTRYEGLDPELSETEVAEDPNANQGIDDLGQYPQTRLVSAGLQISF